MNTCLKCGSSNIRHDTDSDMCINCGYIVLVAVKLSESPKTSVLSKNISLRPEKVWGIERYYIVGEHEEPIRRLTGKMTLTLEDMEQLIKLGFTFSFVQQIENSKVMELVNRSAVQ